MILVGGESTKIELKMGWYKVYVMNNVNSLCTLDNIDERKINHQHPPFHYVASKIEERINHHQVPTNFISLFDMFSLISSVCVICVCVRVFACILLFTFFYLTSIETNVLVKFTTSDYSSKKKQYYRQICCGAS